MSSLQLSAAQERLLTSLVNLSNEEDSLVRGQDIANEIDRNPGTVRNQMQSLKALQLVEGIPGPKGGYKPTTNAYETLDVHRMEDSAQVPVERDGEPVEGVNVQEIDFSTVHDPERCRAEIVLRGPVRGFDRHDAVTIGPTPTSNLELSGSVETANEVENTLILDVQTIQTSGHGQ